MKKFVALFAGLLSLFYARSQAFTLDPTFAEKGWTYTAFDKGRNIAGAVGRKVLLQKDGSYVIAFNIYSTTMLARYTSNGVLDKSYGVEGFSERVTGEWGMATAQSDGKIVMIGSYNDPGAAATFTAFIRYNTDGLLDRNFGVGGKLITNLLPDFININSMAIQSDGKIILAGSAAIPNTFNREFALVRFDQDGLLDKGFGGDGKVTTRFGVSGEANILVFQSDGKIVAAGYARETESALDDFALVRYNSDGTLDASFSGDGKVTTGFGGDDYVAALVVQSDGKIVAAGRNWSNTDYDSDFALARYNTNGTLDASFSGDGKVTTGFGGDDFAFDIAQQADGKLVVSGYADRGQIDLPSFALARYNTNGTLDASFSGDGKVHISIFDENYAYSVGVQADGKIVVGGTVKENRGSDERFALVRYDGDGSLDDSFDSDGIVTGFYPTGQYQINAIAVQNDGKVVVVGTTNNPLTDLFEIAMARYHADGTLDQSFDGDGVLVTDLIASSEMVRGLAIQSDGKIIVAGDSYSADPYTSDFALRRYNPDGTPDGTFGTGGKVVTDFGGRIEKVSSLALQSDGKIIVAGTMFDLTTYNNSFALARYHSNGSLDVSFDGDGKVITDLSGADDHVTSLTIQPDGKIIAAGVSANDFALVRYHPNGSLDNSFDGDGKVTTDFGGTAEIANAVALQGDGRIVVAGWSSALYDVTSKKFALARYYTNGLLDDSFDGDGKVSIDFMSGGDEAFSLSLQGDGKIIAVGSAQGDNNFIFDIALARLNADGSLDVSFDGDGKALADFSEGSYDKGFSSYLHQGRLYVGGYSAAMPSLMGLLAAYQVGCIEQAYYRDSDKDGYGDPAQKVVACTAPKGYVTNNTDCNDTDAARHPAANETCDNLRDDNCDGQVDEGCPSKPFITINDVVVDETAGAAVLTVRLSKKSAEAVTVRYYTVDRTANSKNVADFSLDYQATSGSLTIAAGSQVATIPVKIYSDNITEGDEYFDVQLYRALGASISDAKGKVTIKDIAPAVVTHVATERLQASVLSARVQPNPSSHGFTVVVQGSGSHPVVIKVMDALGRLVESKMGLTPTATLQIGNSYRPGIYFAEMVQGAERVLVQLVKGQ